MQIYSSFIIIILAQSNHTPIRKSIIKIIMRLVLLYYFEIQRKKDKWDMFDDQQQKLLEVHLYKVRREYKKNKNVYGVSGFDQNFDEELKKLVLLYAFDFQAIALHLYYIFPQYSHRLKPQAVSYRWYQLTIQKDGQRIDQQLLEQTLKKDIRDQRQSSYVEQILQKDEQEEDYFQYNLQQKKSQYELALKMATILDYQEENGFMLYKPKFIVDSEFKLQRKKTEDTNGLESLLHNEYHSQFGMFQAPQAAPIGQCLHLIQHNFTAPEIRPSEPSSIEQEDYLDQDWQAYQSD